MDISFLGNITVVLFGAFLFLVSGAAIGFAISRRRYLIPLLQMESEVRKIRNESLRNELLGEAFVAMSEPGGTEPEALQKPAADTEPEAEGSDSEARANLAALELLISDLRVDLEERTLERDLISEERKQDTRILRDEIFELTRKIKHLRGESVETDDAGVAGFTDIMFEDSTSVNIPVRPEIEMNKSVDTDTGKPVPAPEAAMASEDGEEPEAAMASEDGEEPDENELPDTTWKSGSFDHGFDLQEALLPTFQPLSVLVPKTEKERYLNAKPSRSFSLDPTQKSILKQIGFDSFERIAAIEPMDIIRVATIINVPISDIENIWVATARTHIRKGVESSQ